MNKGTPHSKVRVFIVDDHPVVRRGLQLLLSLEPDFMVCGEAASAPEALAGITALEPDVAIIDLNLWGGSGLELISQIRAQCPMLKVLVFTMYDTYEDRALRAGAHGYVTKEQGAEKAIEAIRVLLKGKTFFSSSFSENMLASTSRRASFSSREAGPLTPREWEILEHIGRGLGSRDIAQKLNLSMKTIQSHRESIKHKLGLSHASELVNYRQPGDSP